MSTSQHLKLAELPTCRMSTHYKKDRPWPLHSLICAIKPEEVGMIQWTHCRKCVLVHYSHIWLVRSFKMVTSR